MAKINFDFTLLEKSLVEKDVENAYRTLFSRLFTKYGLTSPFGCDGHLTDENGLDVLCEFKYNENLKIKIEQVKILVQQLYYLKKFEKSGTKLPKVLFVGDINECFAIHTNPITKYLSYDLNWSIAPSNAHKMNPELIQEMIADESINPFVFDLNSDFVWSAISRKLIDLSTNVKRLIKVIDSNIVQVFEYFCTNVLDGKCKLNAHDKAALFVNRLINDKNIYLHPKKTGCLITSDFGEIKVNEQNYINFFQHFDGSQYSIKEKEELVKIVDRIIEDSKRRKSADFFTPTILVNESHKRISEKFGDNWKDEYVIWDCAWGTGNLTRDYKFKELYCSTLHQSEIDVANANRVNPEATKFQYDFLNDDLDKLPNDLIESLKNNKKIIFFINPPYKRSGDLKSTTKKDIISDRGVSDTIISEDMKNNKWGGSANLYTQFLYKIWKIKNQFKLSNCNICVYTPELFLSGSSFKEFRNKFFNDFKYENGYLTSADMFSDVSESWGILFSIWSQGETKLKNNFKVDIYNIDNLELINIGNKILYNLDLEISANIWVKSKLKNKKSNNFFPHLKSGLNVSESKKGTLIPNSIGYFYNHTNQVQYNQTKVSLLSTIYSQGQGLSIINDNFYDCMSLFTAKKLIVSNSEISKMEYIAPNELHPQFKQFQYDSLVYSLFNTSSNQSSMRQIDYDDKKWDIKNEFFWMSKNDMMELADKEGFDDVYYDAKDSNERYVYDLLFNQGIYDKLSPDAKLVLDTATELVKKSFSMRKTISEQKPEYHLNTFDAGWYQNKLVIKEYFRLDYAMFLSKYKAFEDRLRPMVYELGFLKQ